MSEIEVGNYIRTKDGYIGQVIKIIDNKIIEFKTNQIKVENLMCETTIKDIVKHSKNIINLIQCGDYVNGYLVLDKDLKTEMICLLMPFNEENQSKFNVVWNTKYFIKSILTKEQYEQNSYKI